MAVTATLVYVLDGDRVLLIRKKRGFGAGKVNGPGGKVDEGEDMYAAALRELREETGVEAEELRYHGVLEFRDIDGGPEIIVHVFTTRRFRGEPGESGEAKPFWSSLEELPLDEMWEDDGLWLPHVLSGASVYGRFVFEGGYARLKKWDVKFY